MKKTYLTPQGLDKLKEELHHLTAVRRREIAQKIKEAKEQGDLSENAEYQEAKDEQSFVEGRILEIEYLLKHVVTFEKPSDQEAVDLGATVTVKSDGEEKTFDIVGSQEANPLAGRISNESPIGQSLMGKRIGDEVEVETPKGTRILKIISIS